MMIGKVPVIAKKERDNLNYERERSENFLLTTKIKAQQLIDDSIQTLKNSDSKISQTEIDKKIDKDLSNLSLAILNLTRDFKIKNSKGTDDNSTNNTSN